LETSFSLAGSESAPALSINCKTPEATLSRDCEGAVRSVPQRNSADSLRCRAATARERFLPALFILALAVAATACKAQHNRVTVQNEEETAPQLASIVRMSDPKATAQLLSGFYALENNSWRWTSGKFSVLLRTPPGAASQGGVVTFAFSLPDIAVQKLKTVAITASVNGTRLDSAEYAKAGANTFTAAVPPTLLTGDSVKVDFTLDKTIPQDVDKRVLGVVATSVGISSK
jgi:hypothetical protein